MACASKGNDQTKPKIITYEAVSQKRKKNLEFKGEANITEYISLAFAPQDLENKFMVSLSGKQGDSLLIYWYLINN